MISVDEALDIILENSLEVKAESVGLSESLGRVLAEEISADRDFPPFDRVTMDGIAIRFDCYKNGQREFPIERRHMAGEPVISLGDEVNCIEVMTGAILPAGTDTVIRYEDTAINDAQAAITIETVKEKQNVHRKGHDRTANDRLISPGSIITPAEIGVLSTVGKAEVLVKKLPRIAIISTGDELVDVSTTPLPHQIRKSNVYNLQSALADYGVQASLFHIADDKRTTIHEIGEIANQFDVLMLSGGVSKGKADYVPEALEELGFNKLFHRIKQRPGKPFWFGTGLEGKVVFAFPGNPVSTFLCYQRYFRPWIDRTLGLKKRERWAQLTSDVRFEPELTYFVQVATSSDPKTGLQLAQPVEGHGSGDLANLLDSNAFMQLPADRNVFKAGEVYPVLTFKE